MRGGERGPLTARPTARPRSPSSLQRRTTTAKTFDEKLMRMSSSCRSGSFTRSTLCIGVKTSRASACTPYWSRVLRARDNQRERAGHHSAWSDQSIAMSATRTRTAGQRSHHSVFQLGIFLRVLRPARTAWRPARFIQRPVRII